jgi:hypothetical protein
MLEFSTRRNDGFKADDVCSSFGRVPARSHGLVRRLSEKAPLPPGERGGGTRFVQAIEPKKFPSLTLFPFYFDKLSALPLREGFSDRLLFLR